MLKLPVDKFIDKCWDDLRGLRRHFLNELLLGMCEDVKSNKKAKESVQLVQENARSNKRRWKNTLRKLCLGPSASGSKKDEDTILHMLGENWSKKQSSKPNTKRYKKAGTYQQPQKNSLHFAAM